MRTDGIDARFDFRKNGDGIWEKRSVHGGPWFALHVETVEPVTTYQCAERGERTKFLPARQVWSWI